MTTVQLSMTAFVKHLGIETNCSAAHYNNNTETSTYSYSFIGNYKFETVSAGYLSAHYLFKYVITLNC